MAVYKAIAGQVNLLPITGFSIGAIPGSDNPHGKNTFYQLESESSWNLDSVTRKTFHGREITLGYNLTAILYLPFNKYSDTLDTENPTYIPNPFKVIEHAIQDMNKGLSPLQIMVTLGNIRSMYAEDPPTFINSTAGAVLDFGDKVSIKQKIESVEFRPRTIITIQAFIKNPLKSWGNWQFITTM